MAESPKDRREEPDNLWAVRSLVWWRLLAALSAFAMLAILAWAPTKEFLQPWRRIQARYNELAETYGVGSIPIGVKQVWIPVAERADRCGTCHLGMVGEKPLDEHPPFNSHPPVPHSPEAFGCTYCHSGQGWATVARDAHGEDGTWPHPIFERERTEAGCGTCHSGLALPLPEEVEEAPELVDEYGCLACHGEVEREAPRLEGIALSGIPGDWVARHRGLIPPSDEIVSLTEAGADELGTLNAWLETRVGAPRLARGKMVFHQLGCLGCHRRGDVGGDIGPDLTWVGDKDVREVSGEAAGSGTLAAWVLQHLREPQALDPDSNMPPLDEEELDRESDLDDLVTYLLSLRGEAISPPFAPPDRARVRFGLGRDVPTTGRGLYVTFCAACHGFYATGAELETLGLVTPMIGIRGYLSTVSARYLVDSIQRGRRGRYMPAWGPEDGGLAPAEIDAIVEYLLDRGFKVKPFGSLSGVPDPENGREVFARRCVACHASGSDDTPRFGRDLLAAGALRHFPRPVLYEAVMRGWVEEGMPSFAFLKPADARDLIAHLMPKTESRALPGVAHDGLHSNFGHQVWKAKCLECHGTEGEGGEGPMLNTEPYLEWAIDPYLAARTRDHQGRVARATVGPISDGDLDAILDYMRSWSGRVGPAAALTPDPAAVARGKELYAPRCTECHAEGGRGSTGPALANRDFLDLVSRPFIVMSILEGRKGTAMAPWRTRTEFPLGIEDAFDLADYILSLGWSGERPSNASSTEESDANHGG